MAEPNNAGPAPETNGLSDDRRAIIASLGRVDEFDQAEPCGEIYD
jgi:hypothetical protein